MGGSVGFGGDAPDIDPPVSCDAFSVPVDIGDDDDECGMMMLFPTACLLLAQTN